MPRTPRASRRPTSRPAPSTRAKVRAPRRRAWRPPSPSLAHPVAERDAFLAGHLAIAVSTWRLAGEGPGPHDAAPARLGRMHRLGLPAFRACPQHLEPDARFDLHAEWVDRGRVHAVRRVIALLRRGE